MTTNNDDDRDRDRDYDPGHGVPWEPPDASGEPPESQAVAPAPAVGALASLAALGAALNAVDTGSVIGRSGQPMLQFKREGDGTWSYGQKRTVVELDSRWAVNPMTFKWGYISFDSANKVVGERLVPVTQPKPLHSDLPETGFRWVEQWAVNLKCTNGADADVEVVYKPTTDGGIRAIVVLVEAVRDRINCREYGDQVVLIVMLEKDSYQHSQYGKVWTPVLTIVGWTSMSGPPPKTKAPAPSPTPRPAAAAEEPPRRRRVTEAA
jgi:hypothetical protein